MTALALLVSVSAFACGHQQAAAAADGVHTSSFRFIKQQIVVQVCIKDSGPYNMLLDTGTDPSAVDLKLAHSLGLDLASAGAQGTGAGEGSVDVIPTILPDLEIGGLEVRDLDALAVDLSALGQQLGVPLHGVLGYSLFRDRVVEIDYPHQRVSFPRVSANRPRGESGSAATAMHFAADANIPVIESVEINGVSLRAAVDTGSSRTLTLYPYAIERLGLGPTLQGGAGATGTGFAGTSRYLPVLADSIRIGDAWFGAQEVFALMSGNRLDTPESEAAVNIGNGLLQHCSLILDYKHMVLELRDCTIPG